MSLPTYRRVQIKSFDDVVRMQDNIRASLKKVEIVQYLDGLMVENIVVGSGDTQIEHKLGRQPLGWFVTDQQDEGSVWRAAWDSKLLTLRATNANTKINIWVF